MRDVTDANGAMVRRTVSVPFIDEPPGTDAETIAAVGIADFQNRSGHRLPFGHKEFEPSIDGLHDREQRDRTVLYGHLNGEPPSHLAVINAQRAHFGLALG